MASRDTLFYRPTRVEISLDAIRRNIGEFRRILPPDTSLMAVVKANAYGHGAIEVAREALDSGAHWLGVAFLDEALELRKAGIAAPVLVLGYTPPEGLEAARRHEVAVTLYSDEVLEEAARLPADGPPLHAHIKLDTGMGRIGLHTEETAAAYIERALQTPGLRVGGLFTHFACADEEDKAYTREQNERFTRIVKRFADKGIHFPLLHAGNSAAILDCPEYAYNMVRLGVSMYGLYPSDEVRRERVRLEPAMSWKTGVVMVKELEPGSGVSYGAVYRTTGPETIATLPVGYGDGFSRRLSGQAHVLVGGRRAPLVGRICMDQCMIRVDGVSAGLPAGGEDACKDRSSSTQDGPGDDASGAGWADSAPGSCRVRAGDEAVLLGRQGEEEITAEELASLLGTINYEITCMVSHRVPRVYVRGGQVVRTVNPL